jgi:hypothetical protein
MHGHDINPPRRIRGRHVDVTGIEGPTGTQNDSKSYIHQDTLKDPHISQQAKGGGAAGALSYK